MVIDKSITTQRPRKTVSIKGPQAQSQATMELLQQQQNQQQPIEVTQTEDGGAEINFDPQALNTSIGPQGHNENLSNLLDDDI